MKTSGTFFNKVAMSVFLFVKVNPVDLLPKVEEVKKEYATIVKQAEAIKEAQKVRMAFPFSYKLSNQYMYRVPFITNICLQCFSCCRTSDFPKWKLAVKFYLFTNTPQQ